MKKKKDGYWLAIYYEFDGWDISYYSKLEEIEKDLNTIYAGYEYMVLRKLDLVLKLTEVTK